MHPGQGVAWQASRGSEVKSTLRSGNEERVQMKGLDLTFELDTGRALLFLITRCNQPNDVDWQERIHAGRPDRPAGTIRRSSPATRAAPVLRERRRLQLPKRLHRRPPSARPRSRVSSRLHALTMRYLQRPHNSANFQRKIGWKVQYLVQHSMKYAPHSLASPALRACGLACPPAPGASSKERQAAREHARRSECLR